MTSSTALDDGFVHMITEDTPDPRPYYAELRAAAPVYRTPLDFWYVTRYDLGQALTRDQANFTVDPAFAASGRAIVDSYAMDVWYRSLICADGGDHRRLRRLVNGMFSPQAVGQLRAKVERAVDAQLDLLARTSEVELKADFSELIPSRVILDLLGMSDVPTERFVELARSHHKVLEPNPSEDTIRETDAVWRGAAELVLEVAEQRRTSPQDDLLTALVSSGADDAEPLGDDELVSMIMLLVVAGHETTANGISTGLYNLLCHPGTLEELRGDLSQLPVAIEELLRYEPGPRNSVSRYAVQDVEVGGQLIRKGEKLYIGNHAANHDPDEFADPLRLDLRRSPNRHLGFGTGVHHCLGAALARMELDVSLRALLSRFDAIELAGEVRWKRGFVLRALESLPLRLETSSITVA